MSVDQMSVDQLSIGQTFVTQLSFWSDFCLITKNSVCKMSLDQIFIGLNLFTKCLLTKYLLTKCLMTKCLLTKCLLTKCLLTKCTFANCLLAKGLSSNCPFGQVSDGQKVCLQNVSRTNVYWLKCVDQMSDGKKCVCQMSDDQMSVCKMSNDQMVFWTKGMQQYLLIRVWGDIHNTSFSSKLTNGPN